MRWTPQAHYQVSTDGQGTAQGKGFWENAQPEPDPEPEPAGPDAKSWKTSNDVPTVTASAAEAVAAAVKAHAELASRLEVADLLEGADGADSIVWKLPGLEQTAPAALPTGACTFTHPALNAHVLVAEQPSRKSRSRCVRVRACRPLHIPLRQRRLRPARDAMATVHAN
eukprot:COSAG02_NODE_1502_length_12258_cov_12.486142_8_plen_169_part_00